MSEPTPDDGQKKGALAWMANNIVAANLLMAILLLGGVLLAPSIKQEVFPEVTLDIINISVTYPGASPEEIEEGIILSIEDAVRGIDSVKEVTATANEGVGRISAELLLGADRDAALNDIQRAVDRITSLPEAAERPVISIASNRQQVISLILHGDTSEASLRQLGEQIRDELLQDPDITLVELSGVRPPEISIEVSQENLRRYQTTLSNIATSVKRASIDQPAGGMKTPNGEVLVRVDERRETGVEFEDIPVLSRPNGSSVDLSEVADIKDGFKDTDQAAFFNGKRAVRIQVYRVGDQSPVEVSDAVHEYMEENASGLPTGVGLAVWSDRSQMYRERMDLLMKNAYLGLALVLGVLALFLEIRLAFWVTLGIPISFLGAMLFMPSMDVSLNMISLFAFILTLGIVVDDAIVVGEAVYKHRQDGMPPMKAAITGAKEVAGPVTFSVLTTVVAFMPMLFVPGAMGKFFKVIPLIVIPILLISLVESLFILPAHLSHGGSKSRGLLSLVGRAQQAFSGFFERVVAATYVPVATRAVSARYLTVAIAFGILIITAGVVGSGKVKFTFMPKTEGDVITANARLPFGVPVAETAEIQDRIVQAAREVLEDLDTEARLSRGIFSEVGSSAKTGGAMGGSSSAGSHLTNASMFLIPSGDRSFSASEFTKRWREKVGDVPGVDSLTFTFNVGPPTGNAVDIELSHSDAAALEDQAIALAEKLTEYPGVLDIDSGVTQGKEQLILKLKPNAESLGVTQSDLAMQVRNSFFGSEAVRLQRGRDELRVYVRRTQEERSSEHTLENLRIRTKNGGEIPLKEAATVTRGRAYTQIQRKNGKRILHVTADVDTTVTSGNDINKALKTAVLPEMLAADRGLSYQAGGEQKNQSESLGALRRGFMIALLVMFALMAVSFRSYIQPLIVMLAIPFGIVGAIIGHIVLGYNLSLMSIMGTIALSGVVVNDSLVLVDAINTYRKEMPLFEAVIAGGQRRFRPILLTSITTFLGLMPMIFETSVQARFLIPMAISLGFGILFVTFITLLLVPSFYMIIEDFLAMIRGFKAFMQDPPSPASVVAVAAPSPIVVTPAPQPEEPPTE